MQKTEQNIQGSWTVTCYDKDGNLKWEDSWGNLITDEGLNYSLGVALDGEAQISTWFIGLTDGDPTVAAGDTMDSHAGWTEVTEYEEANRPSWQNSEVENQIISNEANPASFVGTTNGITVGGAFLVSDDTKDGTTGTLFSVGAFEAGNKTLDEGDTLQVTSQYSNSSS